jgi:outer membrane protein assembly factor BamE (lipoprotein component of BamABCDE complex)
MLTACSKDLFLVHNGNMPAAEKIDQIKTGQTKEEVLTLLGSPSATSDFGAPTWLYMSSTVKKMAFFKPEEVERHVLEIRFDSNGQAQKITRLTLADGQNLTVDPEETATMGHNIGFFRKYFGGVGTYMPVAPSKE